jgi:hypothetical protein
MANAKKCDKCKSFYDPYRGVRYRVDGELYSAFSVVLSNAFKMKAFDMCPACMKETINFLGIEVEKEDKP